MIVDTRTDGFLRQYGSSDEKAHRLAMDRLLTDGIVDRVEYAPEDVGEVSATFKRWFSVDATDTHRRTGNSFSPPSTDLTPATVSTFSNWTATF